MSVNFNRASSILACALGILLSLGVWSCTTESIPYPTLENQGILALSTTNPYLGSNLLLSREAESSLYLFNFMEGKGGPTAIEVLQEGFKEPRILMYYPKDREVYAADLVTNKKSREWIVKGPFPIEWRDQRELTRMQAAMIGEPVFVINGREHRFRFQRPVQARPSIVVVTATPTTKPKTKKPIVVKQNVVVEPTATPTPNRPPNSDQLAIEQAKKLSERDAAGNILHTVKGSETLASIATWYTGSELSAKEIAEANHLADGASPEKGAKIQIPAKLVKEFRPMPEGYK